MTTTPNDPARRRHLLAAAVLATALAVWPALASAQDATAQDTPQEPPAQTDGTPTSPASGRNGNGNGDLTGIERTNGGLILDFRDASINTVLDELSTAAGLIIVRQVEPEGRVTLTSRQPVSADDAVTLLNTVLYNAGYIAIKQGRILKVVSRDDAGQQPIPVRSGADPEAIEPTDELITQVIPLRHADATQLREDLAEIVNPQAPFAANASSNALVLTDTAANVRRVVEIINALDTSLAGSVEVKVFQLDFADARNTAQLINDVFGELSVGPGGESGGAGGDGGRGGRGRGDARDQMRQRFMQMMQGGGAGGGARGSNVNAAADERTNSIVVTGPGDTLETVAEVLAEIDSNPIADETVFVYRLRNAQAINIEGVVNDLFDSTGARSTGGAANTTSDFPDRLLNFRSSTGGRTSSTLGGGGGGGARGGMGARAGGTGGGTRSFAQQQNRGRTTGGRQPSRQAQETAAGLAGQVTIIADADTNSLLVRTNPQNYEKVRSVLEELDRPVAQVLIKVLIAEVTHDDTVDLGAELSVLNLRAAGLGQEADTNFNIPTAGPSGTGLVVQILEQDFSAAIRALETEGKLDVLSRPYILASDNQVASITVGQEVPFVTNSRITDQGGIINTIEYGDIGILLDVIPHINPDGLVILDVAPEISTLTGTSVPISELVNAPVIAKRSAISRVGVKNGQTIVIGGLMEDRRTASINKVPLLGDIPLLGALFRRTQTTKAKTELLIFLTPHVATDPERLDEMAGDELEGTQLVPNAVQPGMFQKHMRDLQRGRTADDVTDPPDDPSEPLEPELPAEREATVEPFPQRSAPTSPARRPRQE